MLGLHGPSAVPEAEPDLVLALGGLRVARALAAAQVLDRHEVGGQRILLLARLHRLRLW
jgi:hypothetical protein